MNLPTQRVAEDTTTRDRILQAARPLFARNGFDGTSVRDITAAAGVNLAAVTYHFESKQQLYLALLEQIMQPIAERLVEATTGEGTAIQKLERVVRAFFEKVRENPDLASFIVREMVAGGTPSKPLLDTWRRQLPAVVGVITEGQRLGQIRPGDPVLLALSTMAQPVYLNLARPGIAAIAGFDPADPAIFDRVVDHCVMIVTAAMEQRA
jgi:AcrR family transcriptional regulator